MLTWFDNPPRRHRRKSSKRGKSRKKLYGAAAAAHARAQRRKKGGSKMAKRRKSHRRKLYGAAAAAHARRMGRGGSKRRRSSRPRSHRRRSWRRTSVATARRAGRQLRYRRTNPPLRGIVGQLQQGAIDAGYIVAGKAASRIIAGFIPVSGGQALTLAVQVAAALGAGYAGKFISSNASRMMLAGGLAGVVESFVKGLNIPYVSAALGDDIYSQGQFAVGAYPQQISAYPQGVSAYPQLMGSDEDDDLYQ